MKPTYDQLFEAVQLLSAANFKLQEENKRFEKQVKASKHTFQAPLISAINGRIFVALVINLLLQYI